VPTTRRPYVRARATATCLYSSFSVGLSAPPLVITEIHSHTDPPFVDLVEIHNPSPYEVDLQGWSISDQPDTTGMCMFYLNLTVNDCYGIVV